MAPERAGQLLQVQAGGGGFYNANSARLILSEVMKEHGQRAVDGLVTGPGLDRIFGFGTGTRFEGDPAPDPQKN